MGTCYIFGAGERYGTPNTITASDLVIAADGGYDYAQSVGITPDLTIGDFDSASVRPDGQNVITLPREKDDTDMRAAIQEGWARGFRKFHIYGGTGGRLDHTLANIQCIAELAQRGGRGWLYDDHCAITAISSGSAHFPAEAEGTISVLAHDSIAEGVDELGLAYSLTGATLNNHFPVGVSNRFTGIPSHISVRQGTLIIIHPKSVREEEST